MPLNTFANRTSSLPLSELDANFTFVSDSTNLSFIQSGTGAVSRTVQAKERDIVSVKDFGAVADGGIGSGTDNSAAFTSALAAGNCVLVPPGSYSLKDVTIPSGVTVLAYGAYFFDRTGAAYVFKLTGYSAKLVGAYISSATNCSVGAVVIDNGRGCAVESVRIVDATSGIVLKSTVAATGCARTQLVDIFIDTFTGVGLDIQTNVSEISGTNIYLDAGTISGGGALIPRTGAIGLRHVGTAPTTAIGGHCFTNLTCINVETGFSITDGQLSKYSNCIADGCSGRGVYIAGNSYYIDFADLFVGTCGRGIECAGTSLANSFVGLRTVLTGVIPSWGGTTFFSSGGYSATFYDFVTLNTAVVTVAGDAWVGDKSISAASTAKLNITGGLQFSYSTASTVAAAATVYFGPSTDQSATETLIVVPYDCTVFTMTNFCNVAPGAAKSFTYTIRKNQVDTALIGTTTGAGVFSSTVAGGPINFAKNDSISLKLVTDAASGVAAHRGYVQLIPRAN